MGGKGYIACCASHLVLSAVTAKHTLEGILEKFAPLGCNRMILTKLDEAACFGSVLDLAAYSKLPIAYVTTGQEVPDDIEIAKPHALARLILEREA